jgi:glucosamine--fructose-6-phosphate aminotransferase (isomerizing)
MCGIIAVVRRPSERRPPEPAEVTGPLAEARRVLAGADDDLAGAVTNAATIVEAVDALLRGSPGVRALLGSATLLDEVAHAVEAIDAELARLDATAEALTGNALEVANAAFVRARDATWAVARDRLRNAREVADLAGPDPSPAAIEAMTSVQTALSSLDRLEVRGRDSAGLTLFVEGHGLDPAETAQRASDPLFTALAVRTPLGHLNFAYKAAAEIGELGDNSRALREQIAGDPLLHRALRADTAVVSVLGHTRWASVGIISEANAHPLNSDEEGRPAAPYVTAALNGDVDNHVELRERCGLQIPAEVTTDAKVIPAVVSRRLDEGEALADAFRGSVADFEGSVAIAASAAEAPGTLLLALRGSGQALYVGLAEDAFVVASEPYGLVEETSRYLRMDGETPGGRAGQPGQVVLLDRAGAGSLDGVRRLAYDGTELPVAGDEVVTAEITTRDIDRGPYPHFFLKEISEAPSSLRKTLRGKLADDGTLGLDESVLPAALHERLRSGAIRRVRTVGQGTAAIAAQSAAAFLGEALAAGDVLVDSLLATELSGFELQDDMSDTLVVAISQSGTTTDTNRTVDLVRARGAAVLAIVNRRNSDLVEKADGVLYTSDGRDVEMSVASTKAFYAQIAAGVLLSVAVGEAAGTLDRQAAAQLLDGLRDLPDAMEKVLAARSAMADAAARFAPPRRYWAVVGNGRNRIAAGEVRIKLSELCYKSIACDTTEDKKHIDLSAEPLIVVCAPGLSPANAADVAKEVAIYRAHKAAPIVIHTEGQDFDAALATIAVPEVHPSLAFVLATMAGHLFGYEAALAIDAQARPLREARAAIEHVVSEGSRDLLGRLAVELEPVTGRFFAELRSRAYDGHLEAATAVRIASLLRYAGGIVPLDAYSLEHGTVGTPATVVEDLVAALTQGIDQLTRPVDAIKHQAKTVTVGISRSEDEFYEAPLVAASLAAGAPRDRLSYRTLRTLAALDPAVAEVVGSTHYAVDRETIAVLDKAGVAAGIPSRADDGPVELTGIKHRAVSQAQVTAARGRDGRSLVLVPETKDGEATGLTLLHVRYHETVEPAVARAVLEGYQNRYSALADAVTEVEPAFEDEVLGEVPLIELLTEPVVVLARRWHA